LKKSGVTQAPQWKKPPYMMQLMGNVAEYEVINKKVLFLLLIDKDFTDRNIKVTENYEKEFLPFADEELTYALKMLSPAITRYKHMLKTDVLGERERIDQISKLLAKKLEILVNKIQETMVTGLTKSNQNEHHRNCVSFYTHLLFQKKVSGVYAKVYPGHKLAVGEFQKNQNIDVPALSEIRRFLNR
jgi:hypothetical protein